MVALLLSKVPDFKPIAPASLENYISEVSRLMRLALDQTHSLIRFVLVPRFSRKKANDSLVILKTIEKRIAALMTINDVERVLAVSGSNTCAHEEAWLLIRDAIRCITVARIAGSIDAARNLRLPDVRRLNRRLKVEATKAVEKTRKKELISNTREEHGKSKKVADKTLRLQRETAHTDGQFGPDGFHLDGRLVTGLVDVELVLLRLALNQQPMGPTLQDVGIVTEFQTWPRLRIDKLLGVMKEKFQRAKCPRVLRWANKHLVFREPRETAKVVRKKSATKPRLKAGRKRGESLQKAGRQKRS